MHFPGNKHILLRLTALLLCSLLLPVPVRAEEAELELASEAAVLMDAETGQVLYAKNAHQQMWPASITKVMTGMLALQNLPADQVLTVSQAAIDAVPVTSSHISLLPGEQLTVDMAMHALAMESANDAANVLAEAVGADLQTFSRRMTETAVSLGAANTHFSNANGLPDSEHYTTAYDMALIVSAALKVPGFTDYFSTVHYTFPATNLSDARKFENKNRVLPGSQYAIPGVLMSKTGWTTAAQGTLVTAVRRGNTTLVAVTLKSPLLEDKYRDTVALMNYGFSQYERVTLTGEEIASALPLGDYIPTADQSVSFLAPVAADPEQITFSLPDGTVISEEAPAVTVAAALGETALPDVTLALELRPTEPETEPVTEAVPETEAPTEAEETEAVTEAEETETVETETEETTEELETEPAEEDTDETTSGIPVPVIVVGLLILLWIVRSMFASHKRRDRRRELDARIRRMKRQMGKGRE